MNAGESLQSSFGTNGNMLAKVAKNIIWTYANRKQIGNLSRRFDYKAKHLLTLIKPLLRREQFSMESHGYRDKFILNKSFDNPIFSDNICYKSPARRKRGCVLYIKYILKRENNNFVLLRIFSELLFFYRHSNVFFTKTNDFLN